MHPLFGSLRTLFAAAALSACVPSLFAAGRTVVDFNNDWRYYPGEWPEAAKPAADDSAWLYVNVPHSTLHYTPEHYYQKDLGVFWYRRTFTPDPALKGRKLTLTFEGSMQETTVWLNGEKLGTHRGGYTEFAFDVTGKLRFDGENVLAVRLDTRPNTAFAPGKTRPDFQYFGGLYRDVRLTATGPVHITDPILSETVNGGGVLLTAPKVTAAEATVRAKTEVGNASGRIVTVTVRTELLEADGAVAAAAERQARVPAGQKVSISQDLTVPSPRLWSTDTPELYTVRTTLLQDGEPVDTLDTVYGIRKVRWSREGGCEINGKRVELVGANLHSESYMRGNALDNEAIDAEIRRLREHGFNFIRMSHYPHDRAFYEACDRYGVAVIDCLAGWQYYNDTKAFLENCKEQMRDQIRVNRNNPCVIAWEPSLNESGFSRSWAQAMQDVVEAELPPDGDFRAYTGGWICWDVFDLGVGTPQADVMTDAEVRHTDRAVIVSEYGDWNFGGFNSTSRVTREPSPYASVKGGDEGMLVQCDNIQSSFSFNRSKSWCAASAYWDYADYAGFDVEKLTYCGVVDVARLPKFGAYFYRSQTDPDTDLSKYGLKSGPMVFIANNWVKDSPDKVRVFTNCDTVELYLDGRLIERRETPDATMWAPHGNVANPTDHPKPGAGALVSTEHLAHPPFTFDLSGKAVPGTGTLKAIAYRDGHDGPAAVFERRAAGTPVRLTLTAEDERPLRLDGGSAKLVWVDVRDALGTVDVTSSVPVTFTVAGPGLVIGEKTLPVRGGRWGVWVRSRRGEGPITLTASADGLKAAELTLPTVTVPGLPACPKGGDADELGFVHPTPPAAATDIFRGKPASASSVNAGAHGPEKASFANDGEIGTKWCAARPYPADPLKTHWWQADLGGTYTVNTMNLRFEAPAEWQVRVAVSDDPTFAGNTMPAGTPISVDGDSAALEIGQTGRYVRVWLRSRTPGRWPCLREVSGTGVSDNLVLGRTATAFAARTAPALAVDGDPVTFWNAGRPGPGTFAVDLGRVCGLDEVALTFAWAAPGDTGGAPVRHTFALEGSADGSVWYPLGAWSDVGQADAKANPVAAVAVKGVARHVRVVGLEAVRADTKAPQWVEIAELSVRGGELGEAVRMDYNAPVTATSCAPGVTAEFGNDGNPAQYWVPASGDAAPAWTFDAGKVYGIHAAELTWSTEGRHRYAIDISADGKTWTTVRDSLKVPSAALRTTRDIVSGDARYVRVRVAPGTAEGFWVNVTGYPPRRRP